MSVVRHQALSLVLPLEAGREVEADAWLRANRRVLQKAFESSTTTHFARFVLLPPSRGERNEVIGDRTLLAFETNFDGELDAHVADLRVCLGALLDGAFNGVEGYPGAQSLPPLCRFFREGSRRAAAFYVAHGGLSVSTIRGDAALKLAVEARLGERSRGSAVSLESPLELAQDLQRVALVLAAQRGLQLGHIDRGLDEKPLTPFQAALSRPLEMIVAFVLAPFFELRDELARRKQPRFDTPELRQKRDGIGLEEDRVDQNGLTHLVPLKPGWYRLFALRMMVVIVTSLASAGALVGSLGGIRTIHFARWVVLEDRRLLFFSNYDGSWEAYLGDFIDKAAMGLTMIWTNTLWYPKTHLLLFKGATNESAFKAWTRAYQVPTQVWYSAYPTLSVGDVLRNSRVRELLGQQLDERGARELLGLL